MTRLFDRCTVNRGFRVIGAAGLVLGAIGCSGDMNSSGAPIVSAHGKITISGKPLDGALVEFIPEGDTKGFGGFGMTDASGAYALTTRFKEPGVPAGQYKVVVTKAQGTAAADSPDHIIPPTEKDEILSPSYTDRRSTILTAKVPESGEATVDFDLQSGKSRRVTVNSAAIAAPVPVPTR